MSVLQAHGMRLNGLLILIGVAALLAACLLGSTALPIDRLVLALLGQGAIEEQLVVWEIRLPRALTAYCVGMALGMSGAALQGLLRNPLADPGVLGVSASAALGASCALYYGLVTISIWALPLAAISGALIASLLISAAALRSDSIVSLILLGVGLSSFAAALMSLLLNLAPNPFSLADMINWMLGSVANRSFSDLGLAAPFVGVGMLLLFQSRRGLSVLNLGEEAAAGAGLNLRRQRLMIIAGSGLATGGAVALAGAIGFVGIVAPHLVRPWVGHDAGRSLLPAGFMAGLLLVLADIGVRLLPSAQELKLGVVAALIGAPAFAWIALQRRAVHD